MKRHTSTSANGKNAENITWKLCFPLMGKLLWRHAAAFVILGLAVQASEAKQNYIKPETLARRFSFAYPLANVNQPFANVKSNFNILFRSIKMSPTRSDFDQYVQNKQYNKINGEWHQLVNRFRADENDEFLIVNSNSRAIRSYVPFSQSQECTVSKNNVTELENMINIVLSNTEVPSTGSNCTLHAANADNCGNLLNLIKCGVTHLQNLFIQSIQNNISTEEYTKLNNAYSYLSVQIQKVNEQIEPQFLEENRKMLNEMNTEFHKLSTALNNTIVQFRENIKKLCISEIGNGKTDTAVSKFKELKEFGNINLLHNIIDIAYAKYGQLNNFDNIIHFITQLPWISDKVVSYEALYDMMEKNTPKILVYLTQIEKILNSPYIIDNESAFVSRLNDLKSKTMVSVNNMFDLWAWKIRSNDYQDIIDFANMPQVCVVTSYLPQIVKSVYTNDLNNFNNVFKLIRKLPLLEHRYVAYKTLLDEMNNNKQIYNSEIIRFAYEVTKVMSSIDVNISKPLISISQLQKLKNSFPDYVWKFLYENERCTIQSSNYHEYAYIANPGFHINSGSDRFVFTWCEGWPNYEGFWKFVPVDDAAYFNIISNYYYPIIYYLCQRYNSNEVYASDLNVGGKWQIEPINIDGFLKFRIKNTRNEYVYAVSEQNKYDSCRRYISVWQNAQDRPAANSNWRITCSVMFNSFVD